MIVLPATALLLSSSFPFYSWYDAVFCGGYFVFSACGGILIGCIRFRDNHRFWHHGLLGAFTGAIFVALCLSALELPKPIFSGDRGNHELAKGSIEHSF